MQQITCKLHIFNKASENSHKIDNEWKLNEIQMTVNMKL